MDLLMLVLGAGVFTSCVTMSSASQECLSGDPQGTDYTGTQSVTASGKICQAWSSQSPHKPQEGLVFPSNYCRNPGPEPTGNWATGPWCYTTDPETLWEYCGLTTCTAEAPVTEAPAIQGLPTAGLECNFCENTEDFDECRNNKIVCPANKQACFLKQMNYGNVRTFSARCRAPWNCDFNDGENKWCCYGDNCNNLNLTLSPESSITTAVNVCETKTLNIQCQSSSTINIITANYGRLDATTCSEGRGAGVLSNTDCRAADSFQIVSNACNGRNACTMVMMSPEFGVDPCAGTSKYGNVVYECVER